MTSDVNTFEISDTEFSNNTAVQNTLSFKQSDGEISDCQFYDNSASFYSGNLFLSFSEISLYNVEFEDTFPDDPYTLMDDIETQG